MTLLRSFLKIPFGGAEWAAVVLFEPPHDAMEMEVMGANPPRHGTLSRPITIFFLIALHLARDAQFHKHISTNCTGFLLGVPRPQRDGIPFFHRHLDFVEHIIFFIFPRVSHWFCLIYIYIYIYMCRSETMDGNNPICIVVLGF